MKAETFGNSWLDMDLPFPCELHPLFPQPSHVPNAKKVLVVFSEPKQGMVDDQWILNNYKEYDLIVAYNRKLAHLPNVRILDAGGTRCNQTPALKSATVSFILSTGHNAPHFEGYKLRRDVVTQFASSSLPFRVYLSSRHIVLSEEENTRVQEHMTNNKYVVYPLGESKLPAFESMFHVAVENCMNDNFFTEKLLDCFRTYTIPIYWGTDAVLDIFDRRGIIFAHNLEEIQQALASLTVKDYWGRLEAMAKNYALAGNYMNQVGELKKMLLQEFEWSL
ncbi:MAG: hypothetical protein WC521_04730 [Bdellovibrionales bacterium]|jgi:hypothetical protein